MKCVIPACRNEEGKSVVPFFLVPPSSSKCYPRWKKFMNLSGQRTERICKDHFTHSDFVSCKYFFKVSSGPEFVPNYVCFRPPESPQAQSRTCFPATTNWPQSWPKWRLLRKGMYNQKAEVFIQISFSTSNGENLEGNLVYNRFFQAQNLPSPFCVEGF